MNDQLIIGYDYYIWCKKGVKIPFSIETNVLHSLICGGSGSGKTTFVIYYLLKLWKKYKPIYYICDFKASKELSDITSSDKYAEFEDCYSLIKHFYYDVFLKAKEGQPQKVFLVVDELAGLLSHLLITKENKGKADEIRGFISSILMLGRSKNMFFIGIAQRFSATLFGNSQGSVDNFGLLVLLGQSNSVARTNLLGGYHFDGEDDLQFKPSTGLLLEDGKELRAIIIPRVSKRKMLEIFKQQRLIVKS